MHTIIKSVQGNGDYDRLTQGVYENFLNVNKYDGSMENVRFDICQNNSIFISQNFFIR